MSIQQGLCEFKSSLYAAWKGVIGDEGLWFSSFNGTQWAPQQKIPGVGSSIGPSLAVFGGKLYAAWKGAGNDQGLYYASFDGANWSAQQKIAGVATSIGPSLAVMGNKLYAAWKGWWDDQGLYYASFDGANWSAQQPIPGAASSIGPSLATFGGKLYASWKGWWDDQTLWYASFDGAKWSAQQQIPGRASSIGPTLAAFGGKLYAAWKGASTDQTIWYTSFDGMNWSGQQQIPGVSTSIGPILAMFGGKLYAAWKGMGDDERLWYAAFDGSAWSAQKTIPGFTGQDMVPAPPNGLHSHTNYYLYSYGSPLTNVAVDICVTQDVAWQSSINGSVKGFGFQLNADTPQHQKCAWQQYCMVLVDNTLLGNICNWPVNGDPLINEWFNLVQVPTPHILPAGYHLRILLHNDAQGNVTAATYTVADASGKTLANVTKNLLSLSGVTSADLAPISTFVMNLVGPYNGQASILSSGAGNFVYTAQNVLVALNQEPWCVDEPGVFTLENANSLYGDLSVIPAYSFTQSFHVTNTTMAIMPKQGRRQRALPPPRGVPEWAKTVGA